MEVDLFITQASELITLSGGSERPKVGPQMGELGIISDGAVACYKGKIVAVGRTEEVMESISLEPQGWMIDATGKVVMPGFIDSHTHLIFAGYREDECCLRLKGVPYLEILKQGGGILRTVEETRKASLESLVEDARIRLDRMLTLGTTTVEVKSGYGLNLEDELKSLEAIRILAQEHPLGLVATFLGAHALPHQYQGRADAYVDFLTMEVMPKVAQAGLAEYCDVFCEEGVFSIEQARKMLTRARELGLKLKLHADEIVPLGGAELAAELGTTSADHLVYASEEGIEKMAQRGVVAVLLPGTSFFLRSKRYANARGMIDKGVAVALATDFNPGTCMISSIPIIMGLACIQMGMSPEEAIVASTINAAHALDRGKIIGSIEVGKQADLLILDVPNYKHIAYRFGENTVEKVIKRGKVLIDRKVMS